MRLRTSWSGSSIQIPSVYLRFDLLEASDLTTPEDSGDSGRNKQILTNNNSWDLFVTHHPATQNHGLVSQAGGRHVCFVTQQTCLLCDIADMLCHTADMSALSHGGHVSCVTQQT